MLLLWQLQPLSFSLYIYVYIWIYLLRKMNLSIYEIDLETVVDHRQCVLFVCLFSDDLVSIHRVQLHSSFS